MLRPKAIVDRSFLVDAKLADASMVVDPALAFTHRATQRATEYWQTKRGERAMPAREDLRTAEMREFVEHLGLIGIDEPERLDSEFTIRLAGTEIEKVFGAITGKRLSDAVPDDAAGRWRSGYNLVRTTRQPVRFFGHVRFEDKRWLMSETLMAPLGDSTVRMIFVAFAAWHDLTTRTA
jgi:hypothetical protein